MCEIANTELYIDYLDIYCICRSRGSCSNFVEVYAGGAFKTLK